MLPACRAAHRKGQSGLFAGEKPLSLPFLTLILILIAVRPARIEYVCIASPKGLCSRLVATRYLENPPP